MAGHKLAAKPGLWHPSPPTSKKSRSSEETMFVVVSRYKVSEGQHPKEVARRLRKEDAEVSVREEPGCLEFSVYQDKEEKDDPRAILLYERYTSEEAFKAHQQTPQFKEFFKKQVEPHLAMTFSVQVSTRSDEDGDPKPGG
jgi:quinol monooxygenase YgiN